MALTNKLTAIADAIRDKTGDTALLTLDAMPVAIASIEVGGGGDSGIPEEALTITGDCNYMFAYGPWDWFIENYGNKITTKDITTAQSFFRESKVEEIPFVINITECNYLQYMFNNANIKVCPKIRGSLAYNSSYINLDSCTYAVMSITDLEDLFDEATLKNFSTYKITSGYSCPKPTKFGYCTELRKVPSWWKYLNINKESTAYPSGNTGFLYYGAFQACWCLDEATNLPVWRCNANLTSNAFSNFVTNAGRLKEVTFETEDGTPIEVRWKSQTIDLTSIGYGSLNSINITNDTRVTDNTTYQALKNDPDWWTDNSAYCRYNHDSAVNTINSLPDTSAYLATAGGTNTIKLKGTAGSATDGGAINTLTAEEIAVATAKGWTVTLS